MAVGYFPSVIDADQYPKEAKKTAPVEATVEEAPEEEDSKPEKKPRRRRENRTSSQIKSNECRMTPDNKVICPFCEAKLVCLGHYSAVQILLPAMCKEIRVVENQVD